MKYKKIIKLNLILLILKNNFLDCANRSNQDWQAVEEKSQNCVIQIFSQLAKFNWLEPYKSPDQQQVTGSGFFINSDGYILTNFHVVDQAIEPIIANIPILGKKRLYLQKVGVCPDLDVALLKLSQESFDTLKKELGTIKYLNLGDSDLLYRTEPVLALGYPLGKRYLKATTGGIAGREYLNGQSFMHMTAAINPGNSGGPLLNLNGEVVGINTAGIPNSQNIGYIVPINDIKIMLDDLYKTSLCRRPELGIVCNHATHEHLRSLSNPVPGGYFINFVLKDSIAAQAGVKPGDMLYEIVYAGHVYPIDEFGDVTVNWRSSDKVSIGELLMRFELGADIGLVIYRNGEKINIQTKFENSPLYPIRYIYPEFESNEIDYEMFGGLVIMQLRANHIKELRDGNFKALPSTSNIKDYTSFESQTKESLVITKILPGSIMHKVECFYPGSIIDKVNGKEVKNLTQLRDALKDSVKTKEISISSKDHYSTVVSLDKLLKDETRLAHFFMFPITQAVKNLYSLTQVNIKN